MTPYTWSAKPKRYTQPCFQAHRQTARLSQLVTSPVCRPLSPNKAPGTLFAHIYTFVCRAANFAVPLFRVNLSGTQHRAFEKKKRGVLPLFDCESTTRDRWTPDPIVLSGPLRVSLLSFIYLEARTKAQGFTLKSRISQWNGKRSHRRTRDTGAAKAQPQFATKVVVVGNPFVFLKASACTLQVNMPRALNSITSRKGDILYSANSHNKT